MELTRTRMELTRIRMELTRTRMELTYWKSAHFYYSQDRSTTYNYFTYFVDFYLVNGNIQQHIKYVKSFIQ
jgi:hypothetical protein